MTPYDGLMIGVVVAGMIWGALRGITWQLASLASLVLGYAGAMTLSGQIAPYLPGQPIVARAISMLIAYVAISAGIFGAAWLVRATLRRLKFEAYDRHLGMLLGGAEGGLLGIVLTLFVLSLAPGTRGPILESRSGRVVGSLLAAVEPLLPGEIRAELGPLWSGAGSRPPAADEWDDLKRPLELPSQERLSKEDKRSLEAESGEFADHEEMAASGDASASKGPAGPSAGEEDEPTLGRVVAETIDAGLGKIGDEAGRAPNSRRRRIGRMVGDILGEEIDRMSTRRHENRSPERR
jgi:membrane protein required for colicin V production